MLKNENPSDGSDHGDAKEAMIEAVLFDIGDTLIHFETWQAGKFLEAATRPGYERLRELGLNPPHVERYHRIIKWYLMKAFIWSRITRREIRMVHTIEKAHVRMGIHLDDQHMADLMRECTPSIQSFLSTDDDAIAVIQQLHQSGIKLGLVSNTFFPGFTIDDVLRHEGLLDYFPVRVYSSEVRYMKPNPKIVINALEQIGVPAHKTIYVGDRIRKDVKGASRVGMKTILMIGRGRPKPTGRVQPDYVIRRLTEIPAIVKPDQWKHDKSVQAVA